MTAKACSSISASSSCCHTWPLCAICVLCIRSGAPSVTSRPVREPCGPSGERLAELLQYSVYMVNEPTKLSPDDPESLRHFRETVIELERRVRALSSGALRHDAGNAVGAARNALALVEDGAQSANRPRFVE